MAEAFVQALEDTQTASKPLVEIATAIADGEVIKAEIIENKDSGQVLVITAGPKSTEATAQPQSGVLAKKPGGKGRGKSAWRLRREPANMQR